MWKISRKVQDLFYQFSANKIALIPGLLILLFLVPDVFTADSTPRTEVCPNVWVEVTTFCNLQVAEKPESHQFVMSTRQLPAKKPYSEPSDDRQTDFG